jgi:hypothetical protein
VRRGLLSGVVRRGRLGSMDELQLRDVRQWRTRVRSAA